MCACKGDTKVKDSFKLRKIKKTVKIQESLKEILKKDETRYKVADQFAHDLVLKALHLSSWDLFPFLFRTNTISASMFPHLLPTLVAKDLTVRLLSVLFLVKRDQLTRLDDLNGLHACMHE